MRNNVISIAKGIGIILMVIGHAEAPELITNFIYTFHMPLFFIAAGYFFNIKYIKDPWPFISKRVKGLYFPFIKYSLVFLILHNLWFEIGLLNETYGNWTGGVTHPYSLNQFFTRLVLILTSMSGYDEFLAGAFWFFRGLLIASIGFLLLYKLLLSRSKISETSALIIICAGCIAFTAMHIGVGFKLKTIPNGGWRETWGIFFFSVGVLYRKYQPYIKEHWSICLTAFLLLCGAAVMHLSGMNNSGKYRDLWSLPITGCLGFIMLHYISGVIDKKGNTLAKLLTFIGNNTLYIFIFHIISFKLVSLIKIWYYGLDYGQIGCHMVIHFNHTDIFWVIYSIAGVAIPLIVLIGVRRLRHRLPSLSPTPR